MTLTSQGQVSLFYTPLQKVTQFSLVLTKKVLNKNFNQMGTQKKKKNTRSLMKTFHKHTKIRTENFNTLEQSLQMGYI